MSKPLPVIILTGYLGAGKTTLLNYILQEQTEKKLAVIENEIGEVSIDDQLVEQKAEELAEEMVVLNNGCVCCTIRGDLAKTLMDLAKKRESGLHLDGVLIELTGAADPAPVVQTFMMDKNVRKSFYVDNVVTLVDAKHIIEKLDESENDKKEKGTACAQIAFSSTVLLNKTDLVEPEALDAIEKRIKEINSPVSIIRCQQSRAPLDKLFNVRAFDLSRVLEEQYMDEEEFNTFYKPKMDNSISNVGVKCTGTVNPYALTRFLGKYLDTEETAADFLRVKAVVNVINDNRMYVLQCVHMLKNQSFTRPWPKGEIRENRIIFIGRNMQQRRQELTDGFKACLTKPLRFQVGAYVSCKTGDKYEEGRVTAHWDEYNAYRIQLRDGSEVQAPHDEDAFVKASTGKGSWGDDGWQGKGYSPYGKQNNGKGWKRK
jgi:G3E family GTPase